MHRTGVSTHPHTDIQQGWYAGINIPLHWVLLGHFTTLFITLSYQDSFAYSFVIQSNFCLYQSVIDFLVYTNLCL